MALLLLGDNSGVVQYSSGESLSNILSDISNFLTTHGWEIWDNQSASNYIVFRARCEAGVPYKYLNVSLGSVGYCVTSVYQDWNNTTHTGVNPAYNSTSTTYSQKIDTTNGGELYIFATADYAVFLSHVNGTYGGGSYNLPTGVAECKVLNPTLTTNDCSFFWFNGLGLNSYMYTPYLIGKYSNTGRLSFNGLSAVLENNYTIPVFRTGINPLTGKPDFYTANMLSTNSAVFLIGNIKGMIFSTGSIGGYLDEIEITYNNITGAIDPNGSTTSFYTIPIRYITMGILK
jgi:hypothetical protein